MKEEKYSVAKLKEYQNRYAPKPHKQSDASARTWNNILDMRPDVASSPLKPVFAKAVAVPAYAAYLASVLAYIAYDAVRFVFGLIGKIFSSSEK